MANECKVEKIGEFHDDCTGSILDRLFSVNGLALIATGSLSCTRSIYNAAVRNGRENQFFYRYISREEYSAGSYGEKLLALINEALACENTSFVVIYASCLEILAQMNFEELFSRAYNPENIPIRLFKRGPLMARSGTTAIRLREILDEAVPSAAPIVRSLMELPPLFPDFNSAAEILQNWDTFNFLITAGGCGGCLMRSGEKYSVSSSRVNDVQIALGCDSLIENGIRSAYNAQDKGLMCMLGSTTLVFTGLDCMAISEQLENEGIKNLYLPSSGFAPGPYGASQLFLLLAERLLRKEKKNPRIVNILGYDPMVFPGNAFLRPLLSITENLKLQASFWGHNGLEDAAAASGAALNLVISSSGIAAAEYMREKFGIPFICTLPVGKNGAYALKDEICGALSLENDDVMPQLSEITGIRKRVAIIAEPVLAFAIKSCLHKDFGIRDVRILIHSPSRELRRFYKGLYGERAEYFSDIAMLGTLVKDTEILISDPVYNRCLDRSEGAFISLPMPLISGRQYRDFDADISSLPQYLSSFMK